MSSVSTLFAAAALALTATWPFAQSWEQDSLAVRLLLDENAHFDTPVSQVTTRVNGRVQGLRLDSLPLVTLNFEIFNLDSLKSLSLTHCALDSLPANVEQWRALTDLDLSGNRLTELPPEIAALYKLTQLKVRSNALRALPVGFPALRNLLYLDIGDNEILDLPQGIDSLENLMYLIADQDSLSALPDRLAYLPFLQFLNVAGNRLTRLPSSLGALEGLESLDLSINRLTDLPIEFTLLTGLKNLDLSNNQLCALGPSLKQWADSKQSDWSASQVCTGDSQGSAIRLARLRPSGAAARPCAEAGWRLSRSWSSGKAPAVEVAMSDGRVLRQMNLTWRQDGGQAIAWLPRDPKWHGPLWVRFVGEERKTDLP